MNNHLQRNREFLAELSAGGRTGLALIWEGPRPRKLWPGDWAVRTDRPVGEWLGFYEADYAQRLAQSEALGDDAVSYVSLVGTTGFFAAAFGCPFHQYEKGQVPVARPIVTTAEQADALPQATLDDGPIPRYFELVERLAERLGPDVPISVPDIQSPFGIAAIIWNKEDFLVALVETPEAVERLVGKTHALLESFFAEALRRVPNLNLCHCPYTWAPPQLGVWLSEDEIGAFSRPMFERFCLPSLSALSDRFGGLFMHCCARAAHQHEAWRAIPGLRGINPAIFEDGPAPLIDLMPDRLYMYGYQTEERMNAAIEAAHSQTRLLFNVPGKIETVKPLFDRLRARWDKRSP